MRTIMFNENSEHIYIEHERTNSNEPTSNYTHNEQRINVEIRYFE